ncbi:copper amine oxidase domain protein [Desulfofarcimen acetoxidans DSM 771]|uniref:Copper amine oxidase domain protein n=1 Tax=Desulfofarcimen acetoxidans (strain ATCC 49208 / DSM 771 / KCTC 5769 / VKM B-1644 / 5575) TaxID=485916 RepID=C8W6S7_DESAS|nr:stalk domain-containing protein [Desulfofarcimen acetoxidans]ACV64186.1 copper amine oxidase domain protein [Desulfofarcimen acetoxidans DSM 771]
MKKVIIFAIAFILAIIVVFPALSDPMYHYFQDDIKIISVVFKINTPFYTVNNPPGAPMDVSPFLHNDRIYVPVRFLSNAFGITTGNITWDDSTQTVTIKDSDTILQMTIGQDQVTINGKIMQINVSPLLIQNRVFLPARYIAEGLGYQVAWDNKNQAVICWPQGQQRTDVSGAINWLNGQSHQPMNPSTQLLTASDSTWVDITGNVNFSGLEDIAVDSSGNVYVADTGKRKIKKLVNGTWTDIICNFDSDIPVKVAIDSSGNLYVVGVRTIEKFVNGTWIDITGNGDFKMPHGLAVDSSGNVYVADTWHSKIKKLANGGNAWVDITINFDGEPYGVAVDGSGNVYVADLNNNKIKKLVNGTWTDITGNAWLIYPDSLAVDNSGNVYVITNRFIGGVLYPRIGKLMNGILTDITGNEGSERPSGIAIDSYGNIYVSNAGSKTIKKLLR